MDVKRQVLLVRHLTALQLAARPSVCPQGLVHESVHVRQTTGLCTSADRQGLEAADCGSGNSSGEPVPEKEVGRRRGVLRVGEQRQIGKCVRCARSITARFSGASDLEAALARAPFSPAVPQRCRGPYACRPNLRCAVLLDCGKDLVDFLLIIGSHSEAFDLASEEARSDRLTRWHRVDRDPGRSEAFVL